MTKQVELNQPKLDHDLVADLSQDMDTPPKPKKPRRWILRCSNQKENLTSDTTLSDKKELTTVTILCESPKTGVKMKLPNPFLQNGTPTCAEGTLSLN
jgi:hypothetical protein